MDAQKLDTVLAFTPEPLLIAAIFKKIADDEMVEALYKVAEANEARTTC
ncbi:MAG: hypothetical protein ACTTJS_03585 [Wolinella sp.]